MATSWLAGVDVVCPLPAYICPAIPPAGFVKDGSLKAEPGADAACPGSLGAVELRHVCDGWPFPLGLDAASDGTAATAIATTKPRTAAILFMAEPPSALPARYPKQRAKTAASKQV